MTLARRLPWACGCHDPVTFGHLAPCVWWETQPRANWSPAELSGSPPVPAFESMRHLFADLTL